MRIRSSFGRPSHANISNPTYLIAYTFYHRKGKEERQWKQRKIQIHLTENSLCLRNSASISMPCFSMYPITLATSGRKDDLRSKIGHSIGGLLQFIKTRHLHFLSSLPFVPRIICSGMTANMEYNHLPKNLKNRYIIARHGFSLANNAKLICSNPDIAIPEEGGPLGTGYGLHEKGKVQVKQSATLLAEHLGEKRDNIVMFCSPFVRTRQTAAIIAETVNSPAPPTPEIELRERWYGEFDMTNDDNYKLCWVDDAAEPDHGEHSDKGIESPSSVCNRTTKFIKEQIEDKMEGKTVILVAHGDVCQIMVTAFMHTDAWRHRDMEHIDTANWRDMAVYDQKQ